MSWFNRKDQFILNFGSLNSQKLAGRKVVSIEKYADHKGLGMIKYRIKKIVGISESAYINSIMHQGRCYFCSKKNWIHLLSTFNEKINV